MATGEGTGVMTQDEMRRALGVGQDWRLIWAGADALPTVEHLCGGIDGPGGTYASEAVLLEYVSTPTPGIEAAPCLRCRVAWVRTAA